MPSTISAPRGARTGTERRRRGGSGSPAGQVEIGARFLADLFGDSPPKRVSFQFWNGTRWPDARPRAATIILRHPGSLRGMFLVGGERGTAEAYLRNDFDVAGDIESAFEIVDILAARRRPGWLGAFAFLFRWRALSSRRPGPVTARSFDSGRQRRHSRVRDRRAVTFHYDVPTDFYRLWLDASLAYSCAYFESPDRDLDAAQTAKFEHLCRKLRLRPGDRLLDIGCGWGGLALHAARTRGVQVLGISLSRPQIDFALARAREVGCSDQVRFELRDYRELPAGDAFDAIVSVGMSEHVGADRLPDYFRCAARVLKPGGVFLNHAIAEGTRPRVRRGPSFIESYVFPDGDIPPLPRVLQAAESAGFEVRDVENLREHYTLTLRHWVRRLEAAHQTALAFVDESTFRVWRLYLAGSAHGFDRAQLAVHQVLLAKPRADGAAGLPLTRRDWYA